LSFPLELTGHLGDAGGVIGHRSECVLRHDHAGGGEHPHAAQGNEVERELEVASSQDHGDTDRPGDGEDRPHRGLEPR
jgi:hypothetical protein